jgi:hypothetical protein
VNSELIARAARNNAEWCAAVCLASGVGGQFTRQLWVSEGPPPPYYPNIVTLAPSSESLVRELAEAIDRVRSETDRAPSIKDSFCDIDADARGLRVLFEAQWAVRPASLAPPAVRDAGLFAIEKESELDAWKRAWDEDVLKTHAVFAPSLLLDENILFLAARREEMIVAGAIANRHAGITGISNFFCRGAGEGEYWDACVSEAARRYPGLPLAGYGSGRELALMLRSGFSSAGRLRVWVRG